MSTAKKKAAKAPVVDAIRAAAEQFDSATDMVKGGVDATLNATLDSVAFEGADFTGLKSLNDLWFKAAKDATRFNVAAVETLSGCKTAEDFSAAQQKIASEGFQAAMATANAFGEAMTKAATISPFWGKTAA